MQRNSWGFEGQKVRYVCHMGTDFCIVFVFFFLLLTILYIILFVKKKYYILYSINIK